MRVPAGTVLGIVFLLLMHPSWRSLWLGGIIALAGALLRLWAAGHIVKGRELTRTGPYAFTRNPLYLGSFIMALGVVIGGNQYWLLPVFVLFFLVVYIPVMRAEEMELISGYTDEYMAYCRNVPLFLPRLGSSRYSSSGFQWSRVTRNREHHSFLGFVLVEAVLILKYLFF